jgi:zinc-binding in reverse transcriptase
LLWKLTGHEIYTANSFYNLFVGTGKRRCIFPTLWKSKAPPSVIFFYTLLNYKLLTKQVMKRRKMQHGATNCVTCRQCPMEFALYLFFLCPSLRLHLSKFQ